MNTLSQLQKYIKIPTTPWKFWPLAVIAAMTIVAVGSMIAQFGLMMVYGEKFLEHTELLFVGEMLAKVMMVLLGVALIFIFAKGDKKEATGWTRNNLPQILIWWVLSALLFNAFMYWWEAVVPGAKESLEWGLQKMGFWKSAIWDIAFILTITVLAPIWEEILFRGIAFRSMFSGLAKYTKIGLWAAIMIAMIFVSYSFWSIHMGEWQAFYFIIPYFLLGVMLTYIYVTTGSLYTAITSHSVNNSFVILMALFTFTSLKPATDIVYILALLWPVISFGIMYLIEKVFFSRKK